MIVPGILKERFIHSHARAVDRSGVTLLGLIVRVMCEGMNE